MSAAALFETRGAVVLDQAARAVTLFSTGHAIRLAILKIQMTKPQLIESIATVTGQPKAELEKTVEAILDRISNALVAGDRVELRGFGIFEARETKARTGRNPSTGESIEIPANRRASFRPSKELKERLSAKVPAEVEP
ncbi:MAG: HU family DNA-binding protein [Bryobacteraceae bacterium]